MESIDNLVGDLRTTWIKTVISLESDPLVTAAWSGWRSCMTGAGYAVTDESSFYAIVDSQISTLMAKGDREGARAAEMTLATAFANCLDGVVDARSTVRTQARQQLLESRGSDIAAADRGLASAVNDLAAQYQVSFA